MMFGFSVVVGGGLVVVDGHPRRSRAQHQSFFTFDQAASQLAYATLQSKSKYVVVTVVVVTVEVLVTVSVLVVVHPFCSEVQHQICFEADQDDWGDASQSKGFECSGGHPTPRWSQHQLFLSSDHPSFHRSIPALQSKRSTAGPPFDLTVVVIGQPTDSLAQQKERLDTDQLSTSSLWRSQLKVMLVHPFWKCMQQ